MTTAAPDPAARSARSAACLREMYRPANRPGQGTAHRPADLPGEDGRRSVAGRPPPGDGSGTWTAVPPAPPAAVPTLAEYFTGWLAGRDVKTPTPGALCVDLRPVRGEALGGMRIDQISPAAVRAWHAGLGGGQPTQRAHATGLVKSVHEDRRQRSR